MKISGMNIFRIISIQNSRNEISGPFLLLKSLHISTFIKYLKTEIEFDLFSNQ